MQAIRLQSSAQGSVADINVVIFTQKSYDSWITEAIPEICFNELSQKPVADKVLQNVTKNSVEPLQVHTEYMTSTQRVQVKKCKL